jgi:very-short-patch-repair endonuclease
MPRTIRWDPPQTPFTLAHIAPLGVTPRALRTAVQAGRVVPLVRGVYVNANALPDDEAGRHLQLALAHQVLRPHAIASHHTAALAWGLPLDDPAGSAEMPAAFTLPLRPGGRSETGKGFTVAVRDLPAEHRVALPTGLLVTSQARTAVDVAAHEALPSALITLDAVARCILVDRVGERRVRDHYGRPQSLAASVRPLFEAADHAATQFTRGLLAEHLPHVDPRRESPLESFSYGQMVVHDLPLPSLQTRIRTPEGDLYPDFLWEEAMVIGEADGMSKYRSPDVLRNEKRRQERLERMGFLVVRWDDRDIRRGPAEVIARLRSPIESRRRN